MSTSSVATPQYAHLPSSIDLLLAFEEPRVLSLTCDSDVINSRLQWVRKGTMSAYSLAAGDKIIPQKYLCFQTHVLDVVDAPKPQSIGESSSLDISSVSWALNDHCIRQDGSEC